MIAARIRYDGDLDERPSRLALGGPGRRTFSQEDLRDLRDRVVAVCTREGMTADELAAAMDLSVRAIFKSRSRIKARILRVLGGAGGAG
ncbi:hypothetical protein [Tautonia plasticadhaerens]|uniref:Uncharacterized protein n=1 Tax=Tautonia plasticadhaerens TaxID=2527974 RepID=A0A518GZN0_9BACT|nr:hypothetical protein [Tautonia plasticadhaerens]QDV34042.1 hypothetical protein ElP_19230 [Tautonia plasticadhaerens]